MCGAYIGVLTAPERMAVMITIFDRVKEGLLTDPGVIRSGNTLVRKENVEFLKNSILELARKYGCKRIRFERRIILVPEGDIFDEDVVRPEEIDLREDDFIRFISIKEGDVVRRYIIVFINKDELDKSFDMVDKWIFHLQ